MVDVLPGEFAGGSLAAGTLSWFGLAVTLLSWLIESALYGSAIAKIHAIVSDEKLSWSQALRRGTRAAPAVMIGSLVYNIASWGGLLFLIMPGIILGTTLAFFAYASVLDRKNVLDSLGYSHRLTWPDWWHTSLVISVPAIVLLVYNVAADWVDIMNVIGQVSIGQMPSVSSVVVPWYDLGLMPVVGAIVWCYVLAVCYVQYACLKARATVH